MIADAELEYLAASAEDGALADVFKSLESETFEELLRLPFWASRKRKDGLVHRVQVIRDLRRRIRLLRATRKTERMPVV